MASISYRDVIGPSFYRAWNDFLRGWYIDRYGVKRDLREQVFSGGRGCVDGDTLIDTPNGKIKIRDFKGGQVYSFSDGKMVVCDADASRKYTQEDLFKVSTFLGNEILVTDEHLFLVSNDCWKMTKDLNIGESIVTIDESGLVRSDFIVSIDFVKKDYYYDFCVWKCHNYISNGFVNHNSLKSSAVSIFLILGLERDAREAYQHKVDGDPRWKSYLTHGIIFRKFASDLATSVFGQMQWAISKLGLDDMYICTKSPLKIVRRHTGQTLLFRGLDDPTKVKSLKPPSGYGYFKYLWCEEWDQFDGMEEIRSVRQSVLRGGHKFQTFYSFNPPETSANWANFEIAKEVEGRIVYKSDYRSVPKEWLGENFFVEAENLRKDNERAFRHEYLGEVTGNGGSVFPNLVPRAIGDAELKCYDRLYLGLDFGFALSPSAFVALYYDKNHHRIILFDEIYKANLRNIELAEMIKERPYVGFNYIMCDSAEPKSIADLEAYGINALPVVKVERRFGFKWLQSLNEIVIDQARTPNAFEEFSLAEYAKDKAGNFISKYPEERDHVLDGTRYATSEIAAQAGFC